MTLHPDLALRIGHERLHALREWQRGDGLLLAGFTLPPFLRYRVQETGKSALPAAGCCPKAA